MTKGTNKGKEKVEETIKALEEGVKEVFESGRYEEWLDVMSRFYSYSPRNCLLIMLQCPNATKVASYRKWQKDFGRHVRKGEKAIRILAPVPRRFKTKETDPKTGEEVETEHSWTDFRAVPVFDVSQTEGDELPSLTSTLDGDVEGFEALRDRIAAATGATVEFDAEITANGSYSPADGVIRVKGGMGEEQTIKTLLHEWAHSLLHAEGAEHEGDAREAKEVQAEGAAYVASKALGIDSEGYSLGYVAGWGGDTKAVFEQMGVIRDTAAKMIDAIQVE